MYISSEQCISILWKKMVSLLTTSFEPSIVCGRLRGRGIYWLPPDREVETFGIYVNLLWNLTCSHNAYNGYWWRGAVVYVDHLLCSVVGRVVNWPDRHDSAGLWCHHSVVGYYQGGQGAVHGLLPVVSQLDRTGGNTKLLSGTLSAL